MAEHLDVLVLQRREALEVLVGDVWPVARSWATLTLAELAIADGDPERAARLLDAVLGQLRPLGDRWGIARCLELDQAAAKGSLSRSCQG